MKKFWVVFSVLFLVLALASAPAIAGKPVDNDGDGFASNKDCNDGDASINPDATEICDGVDNNCDGVIDEGCGEPTCVDNDGDGYGDPADASCTYAELDCDDVLASVNPGVAEVCDNGIDDNCDGQIDEGCSTCVPVAEDCSDGTDNDCDGATDCADSDCSSDPACSNPHSGLLYQEYPTNCMGCHNTQFNDMAGALHYTWVGANTPDMVNATNTEQGKLTNAVNSYCINILGDWPVCGSCHVGRGLRPDDPQADNSNIDCLMCHSQTDYPLVRARLADGSMGAPEGTAVATLNSYVQNIGAPTRTNCLKCHANAGGGDAVKRGDLSMADIANTDPDFDVHMNTAGANVACQDCHAFVNHKVTGKGSDLRVTDHAAEVLCTTCHTGMDSGTGHLDAGANRTDADRHINRVSCQACHIDLYGKVATEVHRDWEFHHDGSPADGASGPGHPHTEKLADLEPELLFWNRLSDNYLLGDQAVLDPVTGAYPTSRPVGDINSGKLYPFKYKTAYQPMTVDGNQLIALDTLEYLKKSGDLTTSIESGLANMGLPTSTTYTMVTTDTYALLNHGVPTASTVDCSQCHESTFSYTYETKLDKLGYKLKDVPEKICAQCHSEKKWPRSQDRIHNHIGKGSGIDCTFCHSFERTERGLCSPCDPACVSEFVDTTPYTHPECQ